MPNQNHLNPRRHKQKQTNKQTDRQKKPINLCKEIKLRLIFAVQLAGITLPPVHKVNTKDIFNEPPDLHYQQFTLRNRRFYNPARSKKNYNALNTQL